MKTFRAILFMGAAASVLAFAAVAMAQDQNSKGNNWDSHSNNNTWPYAKTGRSPVLAVVGDVACQPGAEPGGEKPGENCAGDANQNLWSSQAATAQQIENMKPDIVALVGDEQYQVGLYSDFQNSYNLTYGAFKMITRPAPGNHEFYYEHGAIGVAGYGYFSYFNGVKQITTTTTANGGPAGSVVMATINGIPNTGGSGTTTSPCCAYTPGPGGTFTQPVPNSDGQAGHFEQTGGLGTGTYQNGPSAGSQAPVGVAEGWYSYNLGAWHLISLNIECETQPGGCYNNGSWFAAELAWLKKDLEENHSACIAAYWHQPTFSAANSITNPEGPTAGAFWQLLYQYKADLVLTGHDHLYARYRPLQPVFDAAKGAWTGVYDPKNGIREFIVGTGGETLDPVGYGNQSDPTGNANFNKDNLEAATGQFWGVMGLTLNKNGYEWDFESALKDPAQPAGPAAYSDKGVGFCHGKSGFGGNWDDSSQGDNGDGN
jgi:hypothetical protein